TAVATLSHGEGTFVITPQGLAGQLSGDVALNIPGVQFTGSFHLAINNTTQAVEQQFTVGSSQINLDLPAGPYLRLEGTALQLTVLGQQLSGDFSLEQITTAAATPVKVTRIGIANATLALGDGTTNFVTISGGQGAIYVTPQGVAGEISGTVQVAIP